MAMLRGEKLLLSLSLFAVLLMEIRTKRIMMYSKGMVPKRIRTIPLDAIIPTVVNVEDERMMKVPRTSNRMMSKRIVVLPVLHYRRAHSQGTARMINSKMKTKVRLVNNVDDRIVGKRVDAVPSSLILSLPHLSDDAPRILLRVVLSPKNVRIRHPLISNDHFIPVHFDSV